MLDSRIIRRGDTFFLCLPTNSYIDPLLAREGTFQLNRIEAMIPGIETESGMKVPVVFLHFTKGNSFKVYIDYENLKRLIQSIDQEAGPNEKVNRFGIMEIR